MNGAPTELTARAGASHPVVGSAALLPEGDLALPCPRSQRALRRELLAHAREGAVAPQLVLTAGC